MTDWESYPPSYRQKEVQAILSAASAGECVLVLGLSGAGKSNLMSFIAQNGHHPETAGGYAGKIHFALVDCNRIREPSAEAFFQRAATVLGRPAELSAGFEVLEQAASDLVHSKQQNLCLLIDRFDVFSSTADIAPLLSNLRALRDAHKYRLSYVIGSRRTIDPRSELAELFYANTFWLGPLSAADARWNVRRFAARRGLEWDQPEADLLLDVSGGYPAFLKAGCEALASGAEPSFAAITAHPAVQRRLEEFFTSQPSGEELKLAGLLNLPILKTFKQTVSFDISEEFTHLTAKEHLLLEFLKSRAGKLCEKDELIRAVWSEDRVYSDGIRDDSLAQLVRRLREKIEADPSNPKQIVTVPGRGYLYRERI